MVVMTITTINLLVNGCDALMICIAIDNGRNNTVLGGCYSAHQAVSKFAEHNIDMVCCIYRKCQTLPGVSGDVNKMLECVTKTDSKFSNSSGMNDAKEHIHKWGNNMT